MGLVLTGCISVLEKYMKVRMNKRVFTVVALTLKSSQLCGDEFFNKWLLGIEEDLLGHYKIYFDALVV